MVKRIKTINSVYRHVKAAKQLLYEKNYQVFKRLYKANKEFFAAMND